MTMDIETKRLLLRPLRDDDAPAMVQALNNFEVAKNLARVPFPYTLEGADFFIALQRDFKQPSMTCAIAFRCAPDELIGVVSYEDNFEFGYWLRQCCWHMGIMSEAAAALVQYAMTQTEVAAFSSGYHIDNPHSGQILRRLGFEEMHEELNFSIARGEEVPVAKMQLTRAGWLALNS
jgi:RimJ/RimL family protein N-acetyltransferase